MRLGQLARKINTTNQAIITYLADAKKYDLKNHPNVKIPDEYLDELLDHFSPIVETVEEKTTQKDKPTADHVTQETTETEEEKEEKELLTAEGEEKTIYLSTPQPEEENTPQDLTEEKQKTSEEETEPTLNIVDNTIKAPKVEIPGVKIIGKIELPEPKEEENDSSEKVEENPERTTHSTTDKKDLSIKGTYKKRPPRTNKKKHQKKKEELSYEEKKKLELEQFNKKQAELKKKEKEKKKAHYESRVSKKKSPKKHSTKEGVTNQKQPNKRKSTTKKQVKEPTTLWGKFIKWLNT